MKSVVRKWGNSAAVRIPASVLEAARLAVDQAIEVREEAGRVVIEAVRVPRYTLEELVAGITPENRHDLADSGPPQGNEFW